VHYPLQSQAEVRPSSILDAAERASIGLVAKNGILIVEFENGKGARHPAA
jgi:hypothetical protein